MASVAELRGDVYLEEVGSPFCLATKRSKKGPLNRNARGPFFRAVRFLCDRTKLFIGMYCTKINASRPSSPTQSTVLGYSMLHLLRLLNRVQRKLFLTQFDQDDKGIGLHHPNRGSCVGSG